MEFSFRIKMEKEDLKSLTTIALGIGLGAIFLGSFVFNASFAISKYMGLIS